MGKLNVASIEPVCNTVIGLLEVLCQYCWAPVAFDKLLAPRVRAETEEFVMSSCLLGGLATASINKWVEYNANAVVR